ncbi:MAG: hypothetical protein O7H41_13665, partial [Planctomycetota bacterium]|nr:hypothetical protein [Planctomycetota bacterium]
MLDALDGPVTVVLEGQQDEAGDASGAAHSLKEDLGLDSQGAGVGVLLAVDDEHGLVDLVGEEGWRKLNVGITGLEQRASLGVPSERRAREVGLPGPRQ